MQKLTKENCSVAVVGVDLPFRELSEEEIAPYVNALTQWIVCLREMRERNWGGFNSDRRMGCGSKWMKEMVFSLVIDLHLEVVCFLRYSLVIRFKSNHSLKPSSHSGSQNSFEHLMCIEQTQQ